MHAKPLLEVRNLVTQFRSGNEFLRAVNHVSFTLSEGDTIGIVGESGSGKSVTSLSVMRLIPNPPGKITEGEIIYHTKDGEAINLLSLSPGDMRHYRGKEIAMIFQEPMTSLNPVKTCGWQVMEAILTHQPLTREQARSKTIELFQEVQLPTPDMLFDRYPHELSGGQKQRVMIAMAMSCNPRVLIADEPTTALDVTVQKTILELMQNLQRKYRMGILFITHDLGVIAELANKVIVMYKGKIVEQGNVEQLFTAPAHPYTKSLIACRPPLDRRPRRLPVVHDFMRVNAQGGIEEINAAQQPAQTSLIEKQEREQWHAELYTRKKILEVKQLRTWFPAERKLFGKTTSYSKAVDDVSFEVYEGETFGLVGESGCGKTTLGRSILKLAPIYSGQVLYGGEDISALNEAAFRKYRRDMQLIFQDPYSSLNPRLSVGQAILEPMTVHGVGENYAERKETVLNLLKKVGLDEKHFNRYPHEFSGGQRQRICIARALGLKPRFIICDESVSALDVSVQAQVLNLLNDLKSEFRLTYVFISHDLSVVKYMCDRLMVMQKGKIEEIGDPDEIYMNPKTEYTRRLIAAIPQTTVTRSTSQR